MAAMYATVLFLRPCDAAMALLDLLSATISAIDLEGLCGAFFLGR